MDFHESPLSPPPPNQEEQWMDAEDAATRALARSRAEARLTRPQKQWLAAMRMAANAGAFFEASDDLTLSAASRVLGKNRSSATRAYRELQERFAEELDRVK